MNRSVIPLLLSTRLGLESDARMVKSAMPHIMDVKLSGREDPLQGVEEFSFGSYGQHAPTEGGCAIGQTLIDLFLRTISICTKHPFNSSITMECSDLHSLNSIW